MRDQLLRCVSHDAFHRALDRLFMIETPRTQVLVCSNRRLEPWIASGSVHRAKRSTVG
jgi:hypothetical protein